MDVSYLVILELLQHDANFPRQHAAPAPDFGSCGIHVAVSSEIQGDNEYRGFRGVAIYGTNMDEVSHHYVNEQGV
jgi:hypothetical protein